jgi:hypothetical protein
MSPCLFACLSGLLTRKNVKKLNKYPCSFFFIWDLIKNCKYIVHFVKTVQRHTPACIKPVMSAPAGITSMAERTVGQNVYRNEKCEVYVPLCCSIYN